MRRGDCAPQAGLAGLLLLAAAGCYAPDQRTELLAAPLRMGPEWVEVAPRAPLAADQDIRELAIGVPPGFALRTPAPTAPLTAPALVDPAGHPVEVRGEAVLTDGRAVPLACGSIVSASARGEPGWALSCSDTTRARRGRAVRLLRVGSTSTFDAPWMTWGNGPDRP